MNQSNTYRAVRIGDVADWRLVAMVSTRRAAAFLRHRDPEEPLITLFDEPLVMPGSGAGMMPESGNAPLRRLEQIVYDHPQVLDDFASDIVVVTDETLWLPTDMVLDDDEEAEGWFERVYAGDGSEAMAAESGASTALFRSLPGLKPFLQRTFPGARIHSQLSAMAVMLPRQIPAGVGEGACICADIRDGEVDLVCSVSGDLLSAATQPWNEPSDIQYHVYNLLSVYNIDPASARLLLSGQREAKTGLADEFRRRLGFVELRPAPAHTSELNLPLGVAMMLMPQRGNNDQ